MRQETAAGAAEVDLWLWRIGEAEAAVQAPAARAVMSADEVRRADRLVRAADRALFAAARLMLRQILAAYIGGDARSVPLERDGAGKPRLGGGRRVEFSLSHVPGLIAVALSGRPVGVDAQAEADLTDGLDGLICSPPERAALAGLSPEACRARLASLWVLKEALAKADGRGLGALPPRASHFAVAGETAVLRDSPAGTGWGCRLLRPWPDFVVGVVAAGRGTPRIRRRAYRPGAPADQAELRSSFSA